MHKVERLSMELARLIQEKKYKEAKAIHEELGEALETYQWCC
jgi:dihydrodipicolinate synthase/N-acetylneuraminate lyase